MTSHDTIVAAYERQQEAAYELLRRAAVNWNARGDQHDKERAGQLALDLDSRSEH